MKRSLLVSTLLVCVALMLTFPRDGQAQSDGESLKLSLTRNFGYAVGGRMQGRFTVKAQGPQDLSQVTFLLDGESIAQVTQSPFRFAFSTGDYALGAHTLSATGLTSSGTTLEAKPLQVEFISAEASAGSSMKIVVPILAGALLLALISAIVPALSRKKGSFELGSYGAAGGAVCPRCGMPYSRSIMGPNLVVGKLERCPHCGKWAIVRRATPAELEAAEARYQQDAHQGEVDPDQHERRYERMLDDSRFEE
ncbi:MAG: Ig-like domain-containing protein [Anaerolineales bacterium]|jgi:hypothetical protein